MQLGTAGRNRGTPSGVAAGRGTKHLTCPHPIPCLGRFAFHHGVRLGPWMNWWDDWSMFEKMIQQELPKTVHELYALAKERQPQDCQGPQCSHRDKIYDNELEWMHQLRRELKILAVCDGKRNSVWRLK
jgi:hypothetical protein